MSTVDPVAPTRHGLSERPALSEIWFTRCPVPTATGLAYKLGWLEQEFARDSIRIAAIQDAPRELYPASIKMVTPPL